LLTEEGASHTHWSGGWMVGRIQGKVSILRRWENNSLNKCAVHTGYGKLGNGV